MPRKREWSLTDTLLGSGLETTPGMGPLAKFAQGEIDKAARDRTRTPLQSNPGWGTGGTVSGWSDERAYTTPDARSLGAKDSWARAPMRREEANARLDLIEKIREAEYPGRTARRTYEPADTTALRDSQDRQGRFPSPAAGASPDRLRERTRSRYDEETYSQPDLSSLGLGETPSGYAHLMPKGHQTTPARQIAKDPSWRPGTGQFDNPDIPTRRMVNAGFKPSPERRQASTESAFRAADASMFNSTVTPKAAPLNDYKSRGKTVKEPKTNIQAFY